MQISSILKRINIRNSDTDSYITIVLEIDSNNINLNELLSLKHKSLVLDIKEDI